MDDDDYQYGDLGEDDDLLPPLRLKEKLKKMLLLRFGDIHV